MKQIEIGENLAQVICFVLCVILIFVLCLKGCQYDHETNMKQIEMKQLEK